MKYISVNFKANHTRTSAKLYFDTLEAGINYTNDKKITIFSNQAALFDQAKFLNFSIGLQNAYPIKNGAFTGEIGLEIIDSFNIKNILIGHSERRETLKESNQLILEKFNFFKENNLNITLCIGEGLDIFNNKKIKSFLENQLQNIDLDYKNLVIAYEPIWAIGTGKSAGLDDILNAKDILKSLGVKKLLYGGSVNLDNAKDIYNITDGLLIGGFGLKVENILDLAKIL